MQVKLTLNLKTKLSLNFGSSCLNLQVLGYQVYIDSYALLVQSWGMDAGLHVYQASTVPQSYIPTYK